MHDSTPPANFASSDPPAIQRLKDRISRLDRAWFRDHPGQRVRYRELIPGEFHPYADPIANMVEVEQLAPGIRVRRGYAVLTGGGDA